MATPLFDTLHTQLARKIFDPVASAATDGAEVTILLRSDYLNRATRFIQNFLISRVPQMVPRLLSGQVKTQSITFSASGTALNSDFVYPLYCVYTTPSPDVILRYVDPASKPELDGAVNPNDTAAFVVFGNKVYGYYNGSALSSGSGTLGYIHKDEIVQGTGSAIDNSDLAIDPAWYPAIVDIASSFHFEEKGELSLAQAQIQRVSAIMQNLR